MLRFFLFLGLLLKANDSFSQTSATLGVKEDWMQMGQDYWIIPVVDKGIYRISDDELIKKHKILSDNYEKNIINFGAMIDFVQPPGTYAYKISIPIICICLLHINVC